MNPDISPKRLEANISFTEVFFILCNNQISSLCAHFLENEINGEDLINWIHILAPNTNIKKYLRSKQVNMISDKRLWMCLLVAGNSIILVNTVYIQFKVIPLLKYMLYWLFLSGWFWSFLFWNMAQFTRQSKATSNIFNLWQKSLAY